MKKLNKFCVLPVLAAAAICAAIVCTLIVGTSCSSQLYEVSDNESVQLNGNASKIVDLWPEHAASFFITGNANKLVGVSNASDGYINDWAKYFAGVTDTSNIAELGNSPSGAQLKEVGADFVIANPSYCAEHPEYVSELRNQGIAVANMHYGNFEEMQKSYKRLGKIVGGDYETKMEKFCEMLQNKLSTLESDISELIAVKEDRSEQVNIDTWIVHYVKANNKSLLATNPKNSVTTSCIEATKNNSYTDYYDAKDNNGTLNANDFYFGGIQVAFVGGRFGSEMLAELTSEPISAEMSCVVNGRCYLSPRGATSWADESIEIYCMLDYMFLKTHDDAAQKLGITMDTIYNDAREFYGAMCGQKGSTLTNAQIDNMIAGLGPTA